MIEITCAGEGLTDGAIMRRLAEHCSLRVAHFYPGGGKDKLLRKLPGYNLAAKHSNWFVLIDLDKSFDCAPIARNKWVPQPARSMCLRIAVRAAEAWLLADAEAIAGFLGIPANRVPSEPELIDDPKRKLIDLARQSRRREIVADLVPREGSGRVVGAAYSSRIIEFVSDGRTGWQVDVAKKRSVSLHSCIRALRSIGRRRVGHPLLDE